MVAIISGKGAGIENSSVSLLGANGQVGSAATGRSGENVYVDAASGNLLLTTVDEMLVGRGPDAVVSRTYNSLGAWDGDNNDYWRASPYRRVTGLTGTYGNSGSTVKRTDWDGTETTYTWNAAYTDGTITGAYVATDGEGAYDTLTRTNTTWTWTDGATRITESYDDSNSGRITERRHVNGGGANDSYDSYITYEYSGSLLTKVWGSTDSSGNREYTLLKYGTGTSASDLLSLETHSFSPTATVTRVFYEYDSYHRLSKVKVNLTPSDGSSTVTGGTPASYNYQTSYTYKSDVSTDPGFKLVATITQGDDTVSGQGDGTFLRFTYDGSNRVTKVEEAIAGITSPSLRETNFAYATDGSGNKTTTITDALGQVTTMIADANGNLKSVKLPPSGTNDAAPSMSFTYEADGDVATMTAAGNTITYEYDTHGNRILERDSLGNTVSRTFGANLYTTPNATSSWSGSNANVASSTSTPAGTALSLAASSSAISYAASSASSAVAAGETVTFLVDLVAGNFSTASVGLFGSSSSWGNNADSSAVIISGPGTLSRVGTGASFQITGLATDAVTTVRVTRTFTSSENATSRVYVGSSASATANGNSIVYANASLLRPATNQLLTETRYAAANPAGSAQPGARVTHYAYDAYANLRFVVDAEGRVTEYVYDAAGLQTATMVYAASSYTGTDFSTSALASWVSDLSGTDKSKAQRSETTYDFRGNISKVTTYSKLNSSGGFDTGSERSQTSYVYNQHGELLAKLVDGVSFYEVYSYDGLGRMLTSGERTPTANLYTNPNSASLWSLLNADPLVATSTPIANGFTMTANANNLSLAMTSSSPISVVTGDKITFTIYLSAGTSTTASVGLLDGSASFGANGSASYEIEGDGSVSQIAGACFLVTGLTGNVTKLSVTRTYTGSASSNIYSRIYVGSASSGTTDDKSIVFGNPVITKDVLRTRFVYTDATGGSTTAVELANGLVQTSTYDRTGKLLSYAESGSGVTTATTNYVYDTLGRLRVVGEPTTSGSPSITENGRRRSYVFYDADGRKIADVDANGSATEYRYDAAGRLTSTTAYATLVSSTAMTPGSGGILDASGNLSALTFASIRPATDSTNDRWTWSFYDTGGRKVRDIDGTGAVIAYAYDGASQLTATTEYSNRMSSTIIAALKSAALGTNLLTDPTGTAPWGLTNATLALTTAINGINAYLLDVQTGGTSASAATWGQQIAVVDGDAATFTITLKAGTCTSAVLTMLATSSSVGADQDSFAEVVSGTATVTRQGGAGFEVTGLSSTPVTIKITRKFNTSENFVVRVNVSNGATPDATDNIVISNPIVARSPSLPALPAVDNTKDRTSKLFYDKGGRLIGTLDAEGYATRIDYDSAGRKVHSVARLNATTPTTGGFAAIFGTATEDTGKDIHNWWVYDARGMLRGTIDAEGTLTRLDYSPAGYLTKQESGQKLNGPGFTTFPYSNPPVFADLAATNGAISSTTTWTRNAWGQALTETVTLTGTTTTTTAYTYDTMRNLVSTVTQSGGTDPRTYNQRYDKQGRLTSELSGIGSAALAANPSQADGIYLQYGWTYEYDASDRLIAKTGPSATYNAVGPKTLYYYNKDGALAYEVDALGSVVEYKYNAFGQQSDVIVHGNAVTSLSGMTGGSDLTQVTGSGGSNLSANADKDATTSILYYVDGSIQRTTDPRSKTTTFTYNAFGELESSSASLDNNGASGAERFVRTNFEYDRRGLLLKQKVQMGTTASSADLATNYAYDAFGRAITTTNALDKITRKEYDRKGRVTKETVQMGASPSSTNDLATTYTYDARDNLVAVKDALDHITRYVYDKANRRIATIDPLGAVITTTYDADGRVIATRAYANKITVSDLEITESSFAAPAADSDLDRVTRFAYDKDGHLRFTMDALRHIVEQVYDAKGNVTRTIAYDATFSAVPSDDNYSLDWFVGQVANAPSGEHRITRAYYDANNRLAYSLDAEGLATKFIYDAKGQQIRQVQFGSRYTSSGTPTVSQLDSLTNADDRTTRAYYDAKGQLVYSVDAAGYVTQFEYDNQGNIAKQTRYNTGTAAALTDTTTLSAIGSDTNIVNAAIERRVTQYGYDLAGRLVQTTDPANTVTTLELSKLGQVLSSMTDGAKTIFEYDAANRVQKRTVQMGTSASSADLVTAYAYKKDGSLDSMTVGSGTTDSSTVSYTYDDAGQTQSEKVQMATGQSADDLVTSYTYNAFGEVEKVHDARGNDTYDYYDKLGRVVATRDAENYVTQTGYTAFGDIQSVTRHGARVNNTAATGAQPSWSWVGTDTTATTGFEYDKMGRLTKATAAEGDTSGGVTTYWYDQYTLNVFGDRTAVRNKLGGVTNYAYDARGLVKSETLPSDMKTIQQGTTTTQIDVVNKFFYNGFGECRQTIEAFDAIEQRTTNFDYDKLGRLKKTYGATSFEVWDINTSTHILEASNADVALEDRSYDARGNLTQIADAAGAKTYFYYDLANRKTGEIGPDGTVTTYGYDRRGNMTSQRVYGTRSTYNGAPGGALTVPSGEYREKLYEYDKADRLTKTKIVSLLVGESTGNNSYTKTTADIATRLEYDASGNVLRRIDGRDNVVRSWYDKLGREIARVDQERYLTTWDRDAEGNVKSETRYATAISTGTNIETATIAQLQTAGGTTGNRVTEFTYDRAGNRLTEKRLGVVSYRLDSSGGLLQNNTATPPTIASPDSVIAYEYDGLGHVKKKTEAAFTSGGETADVTSYQYDNAGRLILETGQSFKSNEWVANGNDATPQTVFTYDGLNNLKSTRIRKTAGSNDATSDRVSSYSYDRAGRLTSMIDAESFTHSYGYDKAGNRVLESYTRTKSNGSTVVEGRYTVYDKAGRAIVQTNARKNGSGAWVFTTSDSSGVQFDAIRTAYNGYGEISDRGLTAGWDGVTAVYQEHFYYDLAGRLWKSNTGDGVWRYHIYDKAGNETLTFASAGGDISGRTLSDYADLVSGSTGSIVTSGTLSSANVVSTITIYDKRGLATGTREPDRQLSGSSTRLIVNGRDYNAFGEVVCEYDARAYDASGRLMDGTQSGDTNANSHTYKDVFSTLYTYNSMGRLLKKEMAMVDTYDVHDVRSIDVRPTENYYYDLSGRMIGNADANGNTTRRRLLAGTGHGGSEALVTHEYHPGSGTGVFETKYDVFGDARVLRNELFSGSNAAATDQDQKFDKLGRLIEVQHRGELLTDYYAYDVLGQRTKHWNNFGALSGDIETTDYDAQGRVVATRSFGGDTTSTIYGWAATLATGGMATGSAAFGGWTAETTYVNSKTSSESNDYFGRTVGKTDMGSHVTVMTYDLGGRMTGRSISSGAQTDSYTLFNTGRIGTLTSTISSVSTVLTATYDVVGNRKTEYQTKGGATIEDATATYDALNRLVLWTESGTSNAVTPAATTTYKYDAASNVRATITTFRHLEWDGTAQSSTTQQARWYDYDFMNRMLIANGDFVGSSGSGSIQNGTQITYDNAGRRMTVTTDSAVPYDGYRATIPGGGGVVYADQPSEEFGDEEGYHWVSASGTMTWSGRAIETYTYTAEGQIDTVSVATEIGTADVEIDISHTGTFYESKLRSNFDYDAMGRVVSQTEYDRTGTTVAYQRYGITYNLKGQVTDETSITRQDGHDYKTITHNDYGTGTSYALGAVVSSTGDTYKDNVDPDAKDTSTNNSFAWYDGAAISATVYRKDVTEPFTTWDTTYSFTPAGVVTQAVIDDGRDRTATFTLDAMGQAIRRDEADEVVSTTDPQSTGDPHEIWYRFNGREMGHVGNDGTYDTDFHSSISDRQAPDSTIGAAFRHRLNTGSHFASFGEAYVPFNSYAQGEAGGSYIVQQGDTLASLAAQFWGDSNLWYLLAEANGMSASNALVPGQRLNIPAGVARSSNTASTFKPFDPGDVLGNTSPSNTKKPKPMCGMFGQWLMIMVAMAVTAYLAPELAHVMTGLIAGPTATAAAASATAVAQTGAMMVGLAPAQVAAVGAAASASVLGTTAVVGGAIIGGALAGAAGSLAGQLVGVATNTIDKISFKQIAMAGIAGAVGGGLGALGRLSTLGQIGGLLGDVGKVISKSNVVGGTVKGLLNSGLTQGIGRVTGLQKEFGWAGVASAGVSGVASAWVGGIMGKPTTPEGARALNMATNAAGAIAGAATRSVASGTSFGDNLIAVLPDVIGSTVMDAIADILAGRAGPAAPRAANRNGAAAAAAPAATDPLAVLAQIPYTGPIDTSRPRVLETFADKMFRKQVDEIAAQMNGADGTAAPINYNPINVAGGSGSTPRAVYDFSEIRVGNALLTPRIGGDPFDKTLFDMALSQDVYQEAWDIYAGRWNADIFTSNAAADIQARGVGQGLTERQIWENQVRFFEAVGPRLEAMEVDDRANLGSFGRSANVLAAFYRGQLSEASLEDRAAFNLEMAILRAPIDPRFGSTKLSVFETSPSLFVKSSPPPRTVPKFPTLVSRDEGLIAEIRQGQRNGSWVVPQKPISAWNLVQDMFVPGAPSDYVGGSITDENGVMWTYIADKRFPQLGGKVYTTGSDRIDDATLEVVSFLPVTRAGLVIKEGFAAGKGLFVGGTRAAESEASVVFNNGWRTADGKFASPLGSGRAGVSGETAVWDAVEAKPGWSVVRGQVAVRDASGQLRYYDGAAISPRGRVIGLETKSGTAVRTPGQRLFDSTLNSNPSNVATGVGQSKGITVQRSTLIRVP